MNSVLDPTASPRKNPNEGYYLDDYEFEYMDKDPQCDTLIINPLKGAEIVNLYLDYQNHLHAIVKEQPYLQYNPITITVKIQHAPVCKMEYTTKLNPDFDIDNILVIGKNDAGYPQFYIYKDMQCDYWINEYNLTHTKNLF